MLKHFFPFFDAYHLTICDSDINLNYFLSMPKVADFVKNLSMCSDRVRVPLYDTTLTFFDNEDTNIFSVSYNHRSNKVEKRLHIKSNGIHCSDFVNFFRSLGIIHNVSRVDTSIDVDIGDDTFINLYNACAFVAEQTNTKTSHFGDYHRALDGRTFYLGATSSDVRLRLYEKHHEQLSKLPKHLHSSHIHLPSINTCRIELQIRPAKSQNKKEFAFKSAEDCWGSAKFSRDLILNIFDRNITPCRTNLAAPTSDFENTLSHLCSQYAKTFEKIYQIYGDNALCFSKIMSIIDQQKQFKREPCLAFTFKKPTYDKIFENSGKTTDE